MPTQSKSDPTFQMEPRGAWGDQTLEVAEILLPNGGQLNVGDNVVVDASSTPFDVIDAPTGDIIYDGEFTATIQFGGAVDFDEVELSGFNPSFTASLSEAEFKNAWGNWLRQE